MSDVRWLFLSLRFHTTLTIESTPIEQMVSILYNFDIDTLDPLNGKRGSVARFLPPENCNSYVVNQFIKENKCYQESENEMKKTLVRSKPSRISSLIMLG